MATSCIDPATHMRHYVTRISLPWPHPSQPPPADSVDSFSIDAKASHCYRIFGVADPSVTDLDLVLVDSAGKVAGRDTTHANDAVLLDDGDVCFEQDDRVEVKVISHPRKGSWTAEVWADAPPPSSIRPQRIDAK